MKNTVFLILKTTVMNWRVLLWNEDDCFGMKTTVIERKRLLSHWLNKTAWESRRLLWNENNCFWMKTTVMKWRRLLENEEGRQGMKTTIISQNEDHWYGMKTIAILLIEDNCYWVLEWTVGNDDNCNWMKTTVREKKQLLGNEPDC